MAARRDPLRPITEVLGAGVWTGTIAGLAAGAIDALWSWGPAAQFTPGFGGRLRFVLFGATSHALAGALAGLVVTAVVLVLSRATRLGDLARFGLADHRARRASDPGSAVAGLALVLAGLAVIALALVVAYKLAVPFLATRKEPRLVVIVAMATALGALAAAIPLAFVLGRALEAALAPLARRWPPLASPLAPAIAAAALVGLAVVAWLASSWETARALPLRAPVVGVLGAALAIAAARPALALTVLLERWPRWRRRGVYAALPVILLLLVLAAGGSAPVVKASSAYTGLGGPIARTVRRAFDWDRDGYSSVLGGGDCDDGDRTVHPGAPELPDDGIDQNCVGGDATTKRSLDDVAFVAVPPAVPKDFRILLITIDTTRADHLGMYGYARPTSPKLDALAKDGTVFEHGWAHAPSTRYSMPAILTGRLPLDVYYDTSVDGWPGLAAKATTIAEALAPLGFATGAITNYSYFDRSRHFDQGFAEYDNANAVRHTGVAGEGPAHTRGSSSEQQTDKAIAFVDKHEAAQQRWFLWVHYYDPHFEYEPHPGFPSFGTDRMAMYDGELVFTDHHIGRLLDDLKARGVYDKTVVVVTGDHGEGFGEHGVDFHGYHLYSPQTKVPLIVRVPGLPARRSTTPAGHVDILPTLVNLAGGKPTTEMMGRSLVDALAGADRDRVVFQQLSYEGNHEMRAGASRDCHVIYNVSPDTSWEAYRVDRDPLETADLADDGDGACRDTRSAVERWYDLEQVPRGAAEALLPARPAIASPLDADLGPAVRLLAAEATPTVKPGETVTLTWTFEATGTPEPGWKLFVHVDGPNRAFVNGDHAPARPFEWWRPGQFIRYQTQVTVPRTAPRGTYKVRIGLFKGTTRAPVRAPRAVIVDNSVVATSFEVVP
ncbi:MAG TPA: sulfatase-like hydrolase/transferase [Kofleriaceae bacterium]|nr:sulfatase-like hydrolase/transferase [Kofleriaceae bacterium]